MKVLFTGGGSLGPVTPLLATAKALKRLDHHVEFRWIGTTDGPERSIIEAEGIPFYALPPVKLPRYPSWDWVAFPFRWARVRSIAHDLVKKIKPDVIVGVGGFTQVPVAYAGFKERIPLIIHQLDVEPGISNKAVARKCISVTTSFEYKTAPFGDHVSDEQIPTPVRFSEQDLPTKANGLSFFRFSHSKPTVLVMGGGTGAKALNQMISDRLSEWLEMAHLIHVTGKGRDVAPQVHSRAGYVKKELLDAEEVRHAFAAADLIISRAGLGTLSEIASLKKAVILVPIPDSQQRMNGVAFEERGAAVVVDQKESHFEQEVFEEAKLLLADEKARREMGEAAARVLPTDDGTALAKRILEVIHTKNIFISA